MKKSILTLLLSLTLLLTACEIPSPNVQTSNSASDTDSSTSMEDVGVGDSSDDSTGSVEDGDTHTDSDNDDYCDDCGEKVVVTFDFYAVNDLHGKFEDTDTQPGVDELSTYFKNAKAENENTILLSSGDMWQGSSESNFTKGNIITEWMNEMDFTAMTLGNHEYDWGEEYIEANAELAEFPFLALNIYDVQTNALVDYCQPSVMVEQSGVKIGIIGAMGDCYSSISADKVENVYFKTGSALTSLVRSEARKLRAQGADCIVYSIHDGYGSSTTGNISDSQLRSYYDVSLSDYVDVVFEGHTHQRYVLKDSKGVYHLQDGGDNDGISHAQLKINFANEEATAQQAKFIPTSTYTNLSDDPVVDDLMDKYADQIAKATKELGTTNKTRTSDEIRQKVADLYYEAGVEKWGDQYDIVLGGGFMSVRSPYNVYAGKVLYGDLMNVLPFDNPLVLCSIQGKYLQSRFFDLPKNYYIAYGEYGESVRANIESNKTYYLVTDRYTSLYSWNNLTEIEIYDETTFARDLLAKYIENGGWGQGVSQPSDPSTPSVTLTDIPAILAIGQGLADNAETNEIYYVQGTISKVYNSTYGNMAIQDGNGNQLYIYGTWDKNGNRYDAMTSKPQVGDTVILYGIIKKYVNNSTITIEMVDGVFYDV